MVPNRTQNTQQRRSQLPSGGQREGHEGVFQQARSFSGQRSWLPFDLPFTELELPSRGGYGTSRVRSSRKSVCEMLHSRGPTARDSTRPSRVHSTSARHLVTPMDGYAGKHLGSFRVRPSPRVFPRPPNSTGIGCLPRFTVLALATSALAFISLLGSRCTTNQRRHADAYLSP